MTYNYHMEIVNPRIARGIAWSLVGIYFVLIGTGIFFQVRTNITPGDIAIPVILFAIAVIVVGIWPVIGALIIAQHPRHPVAWLLFATFPVVAIDMFTVGYASYATFMGSSSMQLPGAMLIWLNWSGLPFAVVTFTLMNLLFPDGKLLSPRWRSVGWAGSGALLVLLIMEALEPGPLVLFPVLDNPYGVSEPVWSVMVPVYIAAILVLVLSSLASIVSLLLRLRSAQGDERQQLKWLIIPAIIYWIGIPFGLTDEYDPSGIALAIGAGLHLISVPAIVLAVALAIYRYRLFDFHLIINRSLVYGALTVSVVVTYVLLVGALGTLFNDQGNLIIALVATGLVAVLFQPLRERLQRGINRMMYGERDEPFSVLHRLGQRLESSAIPENTLPALVETVCQTLKLPYAEVTLRHGEGFECAARYGKTGNEIIPFTILIQGETIGYLNVALRRQNEPLGKSDERLLRQIAGQVGPIAQAVQLARDLRQSRARLVSAQEEERRRLRRDLHDGLGPVLASQGLKIAAVRHLMESDSAVAWKLLDELAAQNEMTVAEIRRLVYALRPPELDELGLVGAVRDYAAGLNGNTTTATNFQVNVPPSEEGLQGLPAAVEVAAYRIATEALTNVTRHAMAHHCMIFFSLEEIEREKVLQLRIEDDGNGFANPGKVGVGLISMRERAAEVGGTLTIDSALHGGTRVVARLPLGI